MTGRMIGQEPTAPVPARRRHIAALIELLDDEAPELRRPVQAELSRLGRSAIPALRRAAGSPHPRLRVRARSLLAAWDRRTVYRRLVGYGMRTGIDLERALFLLGRLDRPDLDKRPYVRALDAMGREVASRAAREPTAEGRAMVLPHYLGNILGYIGAEVDFSHPDNIHLHRAIERKRGMPLTLTAIYLLVARRAGIPAAALPLPGRVLLRLYTDDQPLIIDPFQGGRIRTKEDCVKYLGEHGLVPQPDWFKDAGDALLFKRHTLNLLASCQMRDLNQQAKQLEGLAIAIQDAPRPRRS